MLTPEPTGWVPPVGVLLIRNIPEEGQIVLEFLARQKLIRLLTAQHGRVHHTYLELEIPRPLRLVAPVSNDQLRFHFIDAPVVLEFDRKRFFGTLLFPAMAGLQREEKDRLRRLLGTRS